MKKKLIVAGTAWMLALAAAEPVALNPFPQWKVPQGWSATPEQLECRFTRWSAVSADLKIPGAGVCRLEFQYRTPGGTGTPLKVRIDNQMSAAYPATEEWSVASLYFRTDGPCRLTLIAEGKSPYTLQIRQPRLELLTEADCRKFRLDAGKGVAGFRTMKGEPHRVVPTEDHIEEGMAFQSRGKGARELRSVELPVQPGRKYRLSFWVKGTPGSFRAGVDGGWLPDTRYWAFLQTKPVSNEWKKETLEFTLPGVDAYPVLKRGLLSCRFAIPAGQEEFLLKDVELEELP